MEDEELEKTKSLNDLSDLIAQDTEDYLPDDGSIEDDILDNMEPTREELFNNLVSDDEVSEESSDEEVKEEDNKKKESLIDRWKKLPKKTKIIIIVAFVVVFIASIVITVLILNSKKKVEPEPEKPEAIVIDNGNYKYSDGILTFLNEDGTEVGNYECNNKNENNCFVAYLSNNEDDFSTARSVYEDNTDIKIRSKIYNNRYVFLVDQSDNSLDVTYLYDILEKKTVSEVLGVKSYGIEKSNYVVLKNKEKKYGLFELESNSIKTVIDYSYSYMGIIDKDNDKYVVVKNSKGSFLVDYNNKEVTKAISGDIYDYNDNNIVIKNKNSYKVVNYDNEEVINDGYDYISLISDSYIAVVSNSNLYIRDYENHKYNESGYRLNNDVYRQVSTYNTDGILVSSNYAFRVAINGNMATIYVKNGEATDEQGLNLMDGASSIDKSYYSYLDGVLYFYKDEDKKELLGSYTCSNKNNLSGDTTFNNCNVAKNSLVNNNYKNFIDGDRNDLIPIINNKFVFIYDGLDANSAEIKLYDLGSNKVSASYGLVSVNIAKNDNTLTHLSNSNIDVIVRNKSNKYGMITLSNSGIAKKYDFVYDAMEVIGSNTLAKQNGKWMIVYNANEVSNGFNDKIMDFNSNYVLTRNDSGKYNIYKSNGELLISLEDRNLNYVKLVGDSVFGLVNNGVLSVIDKDKNTLIDNIKVGSATNDFNYGLLFNISMLNATTGVINVLEDGKTKESHNFSIVVSKPDGDGTGIGSGAAPSNDGENS